MIMYDARDFSVTQQQEQQQDKRVLGVRMKKAVDIYDTSKSSCIQLDY